MGVCFLMMESRKQSVSHQVNDKASGESSPKYEAAAPYILRLVFVLNLELETFALLMTGL